MTVWGTLLWGTTRMKKLTVFLVLLLVAAGAWYYLAPRLAAKHLRDAAAAGDVSRLNQLVDFPRVRANMKADLKKRVATNEPTGTAIVTGVAVDGLVDRIMTPQGLVRLARLGPAAGLVAMGYRNLVTFFVTTKNPAQPKNAVTYVFGPTGVDWRLQRIDLPDLVIVAGGITP